jgi:hypothetical protein
MRGVLQKTSSNLFFARHSREGGNRSSQSEVGHPCRHGEKATWMSRFAVAKALPAFAGMTSSGFFRNCLLAMALCGLAALAQAAVPANDVLARGARDGNAPAWAIAVATPPGWTRDCCTYARAIGADAVLYQGEWSGNPQRVMVLNVSPRKLPTLTAEVQADRKRYLQHDPAGKVSGFAVRHRTMPCEATVYQGSDHVDDVVVFCDPGETSGIRLSWSMAFDDADPSRRALLDDFMRVVVAARYASDAGTSAPHAR